MKNNKIKIFKTIHSKCGCTVVKGHELIAESYKSYLTDESKYSGTAPEYIYFPKTTEETSSAVLEIIKRGGSITVSGARTGITGGCVPQNVNNVISTENIIIKPELTHYNDTDQWTLKAGAGSKLSEINSYIINKNYSSTAGTIPDLFYPVDPTETNASAAGMASTNASGARTFYYGPTRNWIKGLTVVLSDGSILKLKRDQCFFENNKAILSDEEGNTAFEINMQKVNMPETKHAAGYYLKENMDLTDLFIGQEGTLGIITEVELILCRIPENSLYLCVFLNGEDPVSFVKDIKNNKIINPLSIEFIDHRSIGLLKELKKEQKEASGIPELPDGIKGIIYLEFIYDNIDDFNKIYEQLNLILKKNKIDINETWAGISDKDLAEMKKFRHNVPERINSIIALKKTKIPQLTKIGTDMSVPDISLKEMYDHYIKVLDQNGLEYYIFGHIGNAHLHVNIIPKDLDELMKAKELYLEFALKAVSLKGSVSAEHGIGRLKKDFIKIQFTEKEIEIMKRIKRQLDPENILNPGVLF